MYTPLITALLLFAIGIYGVIANRTLVRIVISVSVILGSITLLLLTLATSSANQSFVLFVWAVEVMEILVAIAIFVYVSRNEQKDINELQQLKW